MPSCLFLHICHPDFVADHFRTHPDLSNLSHREQQMSLNQTWYGDSFFYSKGLKKCGWEAEDLIINEALQEAWKREHDSTLTGEALLVRQIEEIQPDVVYLHDLALGTKSFFKLVRPHTRLIVGQIASPVPPRASMEEFDIIFSSFPHFVERFRAQGITAYYQPLAFEADILETIQTENKSIPVSYVGGFSKLHAGRNQTIEKIAQKIPLEIWGYGISTLPTGSAIRKRANGPLWGREMFHALAQSRITINGHIDAADCFANNMRLFEATGCGALLITDYKDNLNQLFEIGKEVVAYRSAEEAVALSQYYLTHPEEAKIIATAGQQRTLEFYSYDKNMEQTAVILSRHLKYCNEAARYQIPENVSTGFEQIKPSDITTDLVESWQHPDIAVKQRGLVQDELCRMYQGKPPAIFRILAETLQPLLQSNSPLLEIGCASGYYSEIIEYLQCTQLNYYGVDYSKHLIKMAREYYPHHRFTSADGAGLPFADHSFPVVISSCVLLHTPNFKEHIAETCRVSSQAIIAHRTPLCRGQETRFFTKKAYGRPTVELQFNQDELVNEFRRHNFQLHQINEYVSNPDQDAFEATLLFKKL